MFQLCHLISHPSLTVNALYCDSVLFHLLLVTFKSDLTHCEPVFVKFQKYAVVIYTSAKPDIRLLKTNVAILKAKKQFAQVSILYILIMFYNLLISVNNKAISTQYRALLVIFGTCIWKAFIVLHSFLL